MKRRVFLSAFAVSPLMASATPRQTAQLITRSFAADRLVSLSAISRAADARLDALATLVEYNFASVRASVTAALMRSTLSEVAE